MDLKKIIVLIIIIVCVVLLVILLNNKLFVKDVPIDDDLKFPDPDPIVPDNDITQPVVSDPDPTTPDQNTSQPNGNLGSCSETDLECNIPNLLNCTPSKIKIEVTGTFPIEPIYKVDVIKHYTIKGYNTNNECEIDLKYSLIEFKETDFTREDFVNYFMETYNQDQASVDQTYIDYLMESKEKITKTNIVSFNNNYYDDFVIKSSTCYFDNTTINYLINDISDLDSLKFNSFSLFSEDRTERTFVNCTGDLYK
jgi:hypothetical protein